MTKLTNAELADIVVGMQETILELQDHVQKIEGFLAKDAQQVRAPFDPMRQYLAGQFYPRDGDRYGPKTPDDK